jgi:predicted phage terminase large subunit-like protein
MPAARDLEAPARTREASRQLDARDLFGLAAADFGVFAVVLFPELHDGKQMRQAPYIELLVEALMNVAPGGIPRLIVNLPPGHMKSLLISVLYTAWRLGKDPSLRILCISYGDDLAHQLSRLTRRVMQSRLYGKIFPGTILAKQAEDLLTTTKGGQRLATSVGGPAAGFRADLAVIDDPMQPDAAVSEVKKQGLRDWYAGVVEQRMVPDGAIIVVMHRLAPDDFTATLLEGGGWFHIALPLVAVEAITYTNSYDRCFWSRKPGDLLSPKWTTPEAVATLRRTIVKEIFETQYQQNPQFGGTGVCSIDRLVRYAAMATRYELTIHCWDLAATKSGGDWTVCAKFGLTKDGGGRDVLDLIGLIRVRIELPDVRELIRQQDRQDKPALLIVDGVGIGLGVFQDLRRDLSHILPGSSMENQNVASLKSMRFHNAMLVMYDGVVRLPEKMTGIEILLGEFAAFPDGRHDDQVDAVSNVAANHQKVIHTARRYGMQFGRRWLAPPPPVPPKTRGQALHERRRYYYDRE